MSAVCKPVPTAENATKVGAHVRPCRGDLSPLRGWEVLAPGALPPAAVEGVAVSSAQGRAAAQSRKDAGTISLLLVPKLQVTSSVHLAPDRPGLSSEEPPNDKRPRPAPAADDLGSYRSQAASQEHTYVSRAGETQ